MEDIGPVPSISGKVSSRTELHELPPAYETVISVPDGPKDPPKTWQSPGEACDEMFCKFSTYGRAFVFSGVIVGIILLSLHYTVLYDDNNWAMITGAVLLGVFYLTYICETFCCNTNIKYVTNTGAVHDIHHHVAEVTASTPAVTWSLQFYHYETRTRWTGSGKNRRLETYRERVNTDHVTSAFAFRSWTDVSDPKQLAAVGQSRCTRIKFDKAYQFHDEPTKQAYEAQKYSFIATNQYRDVHYDFSEKFSIENYRPAALATTTEKLPFFLKGRWYILSVLLLLELPFSFMMKMQSPLVDYLYVKRLYTN